jgi:hypothetical protein
MIFPDTITRYARTGQNARGDAILAAAQPLQVRWEDVQRLVKNQRGEEVMSQARVFAKSEIRVGDEVVREGIRYQVLSGGRIQSPFGATSHWEIYV